MAFAPTDATNYSAVPATTVLIDVQRKALTVTPTGMNKIYNGTDAAAVMLSDDRRPGDDLTITFATATFNNRNVGSASRSPSMASPSPGRRPATTRSTPVRMRWPTSPSAHCRSPPSATAALQRHQELGGCAHSGYALHS